MPLIDPTTWKANEQAIEKFLASLPGLPSNKAGTHSKQPTPPAAAPKRVRVVRPDVSASNELLGVYQLNAYLTRLVDVLEDRVRARDSIIRSLSSQAKSLRRQVKYLQSQVEILRRVQTGLEKPLVPLPNRRRPKRAS